MPYRNVKFLKEIAAFLWNSNRKQDFLEKKNVMKKVEFLFRKYYCVIHAHFPKEGGFFFSTRLGKPMQESDISTNRGCYTQSISYKQNHLQFLCKEVCAMISNQFSHLC